MISPGAAITSAATISHWNPRSLFLRSSLATSKAAPRSDVDTAANFSQRPSRVARATANTTIDGTIVIAPINTSESTFRA